MCVVEGVVSGQGMVCMVMVIGNGSVKSLGLVSRNPSTCTRLFKAIGRESTFVVV